MQLLEIVKAVGSNLEDYEIKVIDWGSHIEVAINLEFTDNGEERSVNIRRNEYPSNSSVSDLIKFAQNTILIISIINRETAFRKDAEIFANPKK